MRKKLWTSACTILIICFVITTQVFKPNTISSKTKNQIENNITLYLSTNENFNSEVPENIDIITAAAIPEAWLTAYGLILSSNIEKDNFVLIHAAASGVGTSLIQLVKYFKATSIGICSSDDKLDFCKK